MNKWIGSGKVIKDPTIRYKEDKASFVAFTMMCKRNRKIKDGDQAVDFIDCICTGNIAELARQYLRDGKKIEVMGPLQSGSYIDRETGKKIYTKTVFVEELNFAETKAEEEARRQAEGQPEPQPAPDNSFMDSMGFDLGEIFQMNIDKLKARYPEGFSEQRANNRSEGDI